MSLFSKLRGGTSQAAIQDAQIARSILTLPLLVSAADGKIDDVELLQISNMVAFSPVFHKIGADLARKLALEIMSELRAKGATEVFIQARDAMAMPQRETALCFAIRTALADGHLDKSEHEMLVKMGESLGIPPEKFVQIFEVMVMMQRPAAA